MEVLDFCVFQSGYIGLVFDLVFPYMQELLYRVIVNDSCDGFKTQKFPRHVIYTMHFRTLVAMFDRVGLRTNAGKTVVMVCRPCHAAGTQSEASYEQRMTGAGLSYWERNRARVQRLECGEEMELGSLEVHLQTQHSMASGGTRHWRTTAPGRDPRTYNMAFPTTGG